MNIAPSMHPGSGGLDALTTALMLTSRGFHVVAIHPGQKRPIGEGWGLDRPGVVTLRAKFNANPGAGVGLCLGPAKAPGGGWLIDVEGDGPAAESSLLTLMGGEDVATMGWSSVRGRHHLFAVDGRFLDLMRAAGAVEERGASAGVFKLAEFPDLEFRIGGTKPDGTVKQVQSVAPPTPGTDGNPRVWNGCWDVAPMPDAALAKLESVAELAARREADDPRPATIPIEPFAVRAPASSEAVPRYVAAAVEKELRTLADATEGGRNHRLNVSAMKLGQFVAAGQVGEAEAVAGLEAAARACGLTDPREVAATIRSGMTKGKAEPRDLSGVGKGEKNRPPSAETPAAPIDYSTLSDEDLGILPLSKVRPRKIEWLWPNRLAVGAMSMVAGEGGLGKSQMLLKIAATLSVGGEWMDGGGRAPIGRTLILAAEDDPATTIVPRLMAMGADVGMIDVLKAERTIRRQGKPPVVDPASLRDLDHWREILSRKPDTRLMIIDPLASYLGHGVNDSKNAELRSILEPFIEHAMRPRGACLLANAHLNKSSDSRTPIHRINGSVAYGNLARSVTFVVRDPDDPAHRIFKQEKCNIAADNLPAIGFRIEPRTIQFEGEDIETAIPVFDAAPIEGFDLHDAMTSDKGTGTRGPAPSKRVDLAKWLVDHMKDQGPILFAKLVDEAGEAGFLGAENAEGRYQGLTNLYRARAYLPKLPEPYDGWEIVTSKEDGSLLSANGKHRWLLKPIGQPF